MKPYGYLWVIIFSLITFKLHAFVLIPGFKLPEPSKVIVNISNAACNNMSTDQMTSFVQSAIDQYWNTIPESALWIEMGSVVSDSVNANDAARNTILVGCSDSFSDSTPSALARANKPKGSATVVINNIYPHWGNSAQFDYIIGTIGHELGHALGLSHSNDPASIMTYNNAANWGARATYLSADDKDGIIYLYPNKAKVGIFGGCSAMASDLEYKSNAQPYFDMFVVIIAILGIVLL